VTARYVGPGGNNANSGLTWALRKLTLNGVEDTPVVAGDVVYVGPGTYRELLTVDVSGSSGNVIEYIADYLGTNTDGVGGVVRITGAASNDQSASLSSALVASGKSYRTFTGFLMDTVTGNMIDFNTSCTNMIINRCHLDAMGRPTTLMNIDGASQSNISLTNCLIIGGSNGINPNHTVTLNNSGHNFSNCVFIGSSAGALRIARVGGITVKNCVFFACATGVQVANALAVGQTITVNNNQFLMCNSGISATAVAEIPEDYNNLFGNATARTNTNVGANSTAYPPLFDTRWFFQLVFSGAGPNNATQVISMFDLASYSALVNLAGTSPAATDMRGTGTIGAQREWGPLEYDSTLKIAGGGGLIRNPGMSGGLNG